MYLKCMYLFDFLEIQAQRGSQSGVHPHVEEQQPVAAFLDERAQEPTLPAPLRCIFGHISRGEAE